MNIEEMTMEEIEARKGELNAELDGASLDRLAEIDSELTALNERKNTLMDAAEKREAIIEEIKNSNNANEVIEMEERTFSVDSKEYRNAWVKQMMGKELDAEERTALAGSNNAIPTETLNEIFHVLEKNPLLGAVDMLHIPGYVTLPAEDVNNDANWTDSATDSADALKGVTLAAYQLIKTIEVKGDVTRMGIPAFEQYIIRSLANKIEKALDRAILTGAGAGSNQPTGICTTKTTADGTYTSTGATYKDICTIIGSLDAKYHAGASFVMPSKVFYGQVIGMVDNNKQKVVVEDAQSPAKFNVLGFPVIVDDFGTANSTDILFGYLKAYKMNLGSDVEVTYDDSAEFRKGSRVWRGLAYADGKLADDNAIVRYKKG